jgi:hypothetical protein
MSWTPIRDAGAPVVLRLALEELDAVIDALDRLGALVERSVGSLRNIRTILAEQFAHLPRVPSAQHASKSNTKESN